MSALSKIEAIIAALAVPPAVDPAEDHIQKALELITTFWRFNQIVESHGLVYYLEHDRHHQVRSLESLLRDARQKILHDLWLFLYELGIGLDDFEGNDWLFDELFLRYLAELEIHFLRFNVEELCEAVLEYQESL